MVRIAGAVLAAGAGSRIGTPKAELVLSGRRLIDRAVTVLHDAGCSPLIAVVRADTAVDGAEVVVNPAPERGMRSSLQLAVAACEAADALAVLLVDLPGTDAGAAAAVLRAWRPGRVAVGRYRGSSAYGHPIVMAPQLWSAAMDLAAPDEGARNFLRSHPELIDAVDVDGSADDLDTPADLARWTERHRRAGER